MALSADTNRVFSTGRRGEHPVKGSTTVYKGSAIGDDGNGYARPLNAGDKFLGFAEEQIDNSGGVDGDKHVVVIEDAAVELPVSGAAQSNLGDPIFASDDDTFVTSHVGNSYIGTVRRFVSSGKVMVQLDPKRRPNVTLTDNTGGTAGTSLSAVSGSGDDATINNNIASIRDALHKAGIIV